MSNPNAVDHSEHAFFRAFNSPLAQEVLRLHFVQQITAGVHRTYAIALKEFFDRDIRQATEYTYDQIVASEFPLIPVSDACSISGDVVDLSLKKINPTTGISLDDSWVSVIGSYDETGNPKEIYEPWNDEQAALLNQQANDLVLVDLNPVNLYYDTWYGWTKES